MNEERFWDPEITDEDEALLGGLIERHVYEAVREFLTSYDADTLLDFLVFPGRTLTNDPEPTGFALRLVIEGRRFPDIVRDFPISALIDEELDARRDNDGTPFLEPDEVAGFDALVSELENLAKKVREFRERAKIEPAGELDSETAAQLNAILENASKQWNSEESTE